MSLYISTTMVDNSLQDTPMQNAIKSLAKSLVTERNQGRIPDGPSLDVTFMLSGKNSKPEFSGMRMGGFSEESNTLYFEREVPEHIVVSDMAEQYVDVVMQDVISNASEFFLDNGVSFDANLWNALIQRILLVKRH